MAVVLLLVIVSVSYLCVRLGAVALELTGMDRERAGFQALSAFTNSGFTTRESEDVVRHPIRRKIISFLMILGNAGMITTIGTFAKSVMEGDVAKTAINVGAILGGLAVLIWVARWRGLTRHVHDAVQRWLAGRWDFRPDSTEDMLRVGQGFHVSRILVGADSPVVNHCLKELDLKPRQVQILGIERKGVFIPVPMGDHHIETGDHLIVYGTSGNVNRVFHPDATSPIRVVSDTSPEVKDTPPPGSE